MFPLCTITKVWATQPCHPPLWENGMWAGEWVACGKWQHMQSSSFKFVHFCKVSSEDCVCCGFLPCTWLQCHRQMASHARIQALWQAPSWIILLMPAKHLASLNKPSSDSICEMLCLPSNEPTLFKHCSGGSFNSLLPDNISIRLGLWKIITCTLWRNWYDAVSCSW